MAGMFPWDGATFHLLPEYVFTSKPLNLLWLKLLCAELTREVLHKSSSSRKKNSRKRTKVIFCTVYHNICFLTLQSQKKKKKYKKISLPKIKCIQDVIKGKIRKKIKKSNYMKQASPTQMKVMRKKMNQNLKTSSNVQCLLWESVHCLIKKEKSRDSIKSLSSYSQAEDTTG